jgi:hypothetical protein
MGWGSWLRATWHKLFSPTSKPAARQPAHTQYCGGARKVMKSKSPVTKNNGYISGTRHFNLTPLARKTLTFFFSFLKSQQNLVKRLNRAAAFHATTCTEFTSENKLYQILSSEN